LSSQTRKVTKKKPQTATRQRNLLGSAGVDIDGGGGGGTAGTGTGGGGGGFLGDSPSNFSPPTRNPRTPEPNFSLGVKPSILAGELTPEEQAEKDALDAFLKKEKENALLAKRKPGRRATILTSRGGLLT
jgi:hypothetical protein